MKSCVTNIILPIPTGDLLQWLCRLQNDISSLFFPSPFLFTIYTIAYRKQIQEDEINDINERPYIPEKPWESNFFMISDTSLHSCCCALFSHGFKSEKPQKSHHAVEIEIN
ncbi:CLUMA_CG013697, isoform A [Clunio marinus]|uniref:CLUMA_CG013697, isoform A n=1 Tax=Clunio marinus TaxID=568069 RepID=A0A1J1IJK9_9DIPT|nr:CLUMA_CG013697, isoform A [Clunio marinus]